jgi:hypothetical protein
LHSLLQKGGRGEGKVSLSKKKISVKRELDFWDEWEKKKELTLLQKAGA